MSTAVPRRTGPDAHEVAAEIANMDTLKRYKSLPHAQRIIEMRRMLSEVFANLAQHGGASADDLRLLAEGMAEAAHDMAEQEKAGLPRQLVAQPTVDFAVN